MIKCSTGNIAHLLLILSLMPIWCNRLVIFSSTQGTIHNECILPLRVIHIICPRKKHVENFGTEVQVVLLLVDASS